MTITRLFTGRLLPFTQLALLLCACGAPAARDDFSEGDARPPGAVGGRGGDDSPLAGRGGNTPMDAGSAGGGNAEVGTPGDNAAPIVTAALASTSAVYVGSTVKIIGTADDDAMPANPGALTLSWTKTSGPGEATFISPTALGTDASFTAPGTYVVRLTAHDGALSSFAETNVVVAPVATGLRARFAFDEAQGTTAANAVMGNLAGTTANNTVWTPGKAGSAINCTGLTNTVSIPHSSATDTSVGDLTISFWMKSTMVVAAQSFPELLWKQTAEDRLEFLLFTPAGKPTEIAFKFVKGTAWHAAATPAPLDGQWHHITGRRRGALISIGVDGVVKASATLGFQIAANTGPLVVCGLPDSWAKFIGAVDDLRFYGRALEDRELTLLGTGNH